MDRLARGECNGPSTPEGRRIDDSNSCADPLIHVRVHGLAGPGHFCSQDRVRIGFSDVEMTVFRASIGAIRGE